MSYKKILVPFAIFSCVFMGMFLYVMIPYWKYDKITYNNDTPELSLKELLKNENIEVEYVKTFLYDEKFLGFNAIVDDSTFMNVTYVGEVKHKINSYIENNNDFKLKRLWGYSFTNETSSVVREINSINHPFGIKKNIYYFLHDRKNKKILSKYFFEIIFNNKGAQISFDGKEINLAYGIPKEGKASLSFIVYKNQLYVINTYPLKGEFQSFHSFYNANK